MSQNQYTYVASLINWLQFENQFLAKFKSPIKLFKNLPQLSFTSTNPRRKYERLCMLFSTFYLYIHVLAFVRVSLILIQSEKSRLQLIHQTFTSSDSVF